MFQAALPEIGPGALQPRTNEEDLYGTDKEKSLFIPQNTSWQNVAEELAEEGIGVSIFLGQNKTMDVGSVGTFLHPFLSFRVRWLIDHVCGAGVVSSITGGEMFFHPRFDPLHDGPVLDSQLRRLVSRTTAYNCALRVRCSHGIFPSFTSPPLFLLQR